MDPEQVREWKRGYEAVNAFTLEEARTSTQEQRLARLESALRRYEALGLLRSKPLIPDINTNWMRLRIAAAEPNDRV